MKNVSAVYLIFLKLFFKVKPIIKTPVYFSVVVVLFSQQVSTHSSRPLLRFYCVSLLLLSFFPPSEVDVDALNLFRCCFLQGNNHGVV